MSHRGKGQSWGLELGSGMRIDLLESEAGRARRAPCAPTGSPTVFPRLLQVVSDMFLSSLFNCFYLARGGSAMRSLATFITGMVLAYFLLGIVQAASRDESREQFILELEKKSLTNPAVQAEVEFVKSVASKLDDQHNSMFVALDSLRRLGELNRSQMEEKSWFGLRRQLDEMMSAIADIAKDVRAVNGQLNTLSPSVRMCP